ncbi:hypothetical protein AAMO2058_000031600 [Amorphochlora amoebiformis]
MEEEDIAYRKRKVAKNSLWQQKLAAWRPLMTPGCISAILITVGVIFIIIGITLLVLSLQIINISKRYDDKCAGELCYIEIDIEEDMDAPVYFYYKLVNFYQNHRSYATDFDINQLQGRFEEISSCSVMETRERGPLSIYPCGLIANSFFNDVFSVTRRSAGTSTQTLLSGNDWDGSDISWRSDRDTKFKNATDFDPDEVTRIGSRGNILPFPTEQDFQVWFRVAGLPRFNKLYRKIGETSLKKGDVLNVTILNNFEVDSFGGEKHIFLSTTSAFGGSNLFLASCYIIIGTLCSIFSLFMCLKRVLDPRPLGQMKYYSWTGLGQGST